MTKLNANASQHFMVISLVILAALALHPIGVARAISSTPTYVLGVSSPFDPLVVDLQGLTSSVTILPAVSSVSSLGTGSILYIDGGWLSSQVSLDPTVLSLITNAVLHGLPTIVVRGNPAVLADSIKGLIGFHEPGFPLISEGVWIVGSLPDGTKQGATLQVLAGFDYAVTGEFQWAQALLTQTAATFAQAKSSSPATIQTSKGSSPTTTQTSTAPCWTRLIVDTTDTGDFFSPKGKILFNNTITVLQCSGSSSFGWYNFFFNSTVEPGIMIYNVPWRTAQVLDSVHLNDINGLIVDHGPVGQFSSGPATITYSIGTQAGSLGAVVTSSQTMSYFIKNTSVSDSNSSSQVNWVQNIDPRSDSGKLTFQIIPGWTDRVVSGSANHLTESFGTTFVRLSGNNIVDNSTLSGSLSTCVGNC